MSYLRHPYTYIWSDGESMYFDSKAVPIEHVDAFVAMRWARLTPEERSKAARNAVEWGSGNFGADALLEELGLPTSMDWLQARSSTPKLEGGNDSAG